MIRNLHQFRTVFQSHHSFKQFTPVVFQNFAVGSDSVTRNYIKFKSKYDQHVKAFQEKIVQLEEENKEPVKKNIGRAYTHPYHSDHHPLNFSVVKTAELFHDFIGPEQVSPHYENFLVARKYAVGFIVGLLALNIGAGTMDWNYIARSSIIPFLFWAQLMYFYLEGRKSLLKPLLVRFYRRIAQNEIYNMDVFYHENIENKVRQMMNQARSQMEFYKLNSEFQDVKSEAINIFLANEYLNMRKHISDRTVNVLKQVKSFEEKNRQKLYTGLIEDAVKEIDKRLAGKERENIEREMLVSAIDGLSKGYMDYAIDPILPIVKESIKKSVKKVNDLSEAEQAKLIAVTEDQLRTIRDTDRAAKNEFLSYQPQGLDSALKNNEVVKKVMSNWTVQH